MYDQVQLITYATGSWILARPRPTAGRPAHRLFGWVHVVLPPVRRADRLRSRRPPLCRSPGSASSRCLASPASTVMTPPTRTRAGDLSQAVGKRVHPGRIGGAFGTVTVGFGSPRKVNGPWLVVSEIRPDRVCRDPGERKILAPGCPLRAEEAGDGSPLAEPTVPAQWPGGIRPGRESPSRTRGEAARTLSSRLTPNAAALARRAGHPQDVTRDRAWQQRVDSMVRLRRRRRAPRRLGLVQTKNGIWLRALDLMSAS